MTVLLSNEDSSGNIYGSDIFPGNAVSLALTPRPCFELEDKSVGQVDRFEVASYTRSIHSVVHSPVLE